ncbi:MAG: hypothetical protein ACKVOX_05225 [Rhizobacter sp.]
MPTTHAAARGLLDQWFEHQGVRLNTVVEFEDTALLKTFDAGGMGVFRAVSLVHEDLIEGYGVKLIGTCAGVEDAILCLRGTSKGTAPFGPAAAEWLTGQRSGRHDQTTMGTSPRRSFAPIGCALSTATRSRASATSNAGRGNPGGPSAAKGRLSEVWVMSARLQLDSISGAIGSVISSPLCVGCSRAEIDWLGAMQFADVQLSGCEIINVSDSKRSTQAGGAPKEQPFNSALMQASASWRGREQAFPAMSRQPRTAA